MPLKRYQNTFTAAGAILCPNGEFVEYDDVMALLRELSEKLDDPDVLYELEDNDLNGSILIDMCIEENKG